MLRKLSVVIVPIIILLIMLLLLAPLFIGNYVREELNRAISNIEKVGFEVSVQNYQQHWLSSDITVTLSDSSSVIAVKTRVNIQHGLLFKNNNSDSLLRFSVGLYNADSNYTFIDQSNSEVSQKPFNLEKAFLIHADIIKGITGNTTIKGNVSFELAELLSQGDMTIPNPIGTFEFFIKRNLKEINGQTIIKKIKVSTAKGSVDFSGYTEKFDMHKTKNNLYAGNYSFKLPSITIQKMGDVIFNLNKFEAQMDFREGVDEIYKANIAILLDSVKAQDDVYGPLSLKFVASGFDAKSLSYVTDQAIIVSLRDRLPVLDKCIHTLTLPNEVEMYELAERSMFNYFINVLNVFSWGVEVGVPSFSLKTPEGFIEGRMLLTTSGFDMVNLIEDSVTSPQAIMHEFSKKISKVGYSVSNGIFFDVSLKVPQKLLKQALVKKTLCNMRKQYQLSCDSKVNHDDNQTNDLDLQLLAKAKTQVDNQLDNLTNSNLLIQAGNDYTILMQADNPNTINLNGLGYSVPELIQKIQFALH